MEFPNVIISNNLLCVTCVYNPKTDSYIDFIIQNYTKEQQKLINNKFR